MKTLRLLSLTLVLSLKACAPLAPVKPPPPPPPPLTLSQLVTAVAKEQTAFETIHASAQVAARELGVLNGKLQSIGYFRRIPAQPSVEALDAQLRQLAVHRLLIVKGMHVDVGEAQTPTAQTVLQAGERFAPTVDELRAVLRIQLDLQGAARDIAKYIDILPDNVDRLLVVVGKQSLGGDTRVLLEAYYERPLPPPEVRLVWPSLPERLAAAGLNPQDPLLIKDLKYLELQKQVELGQNRVADVRRVLAIAADFPRWQLRWQLFADRAAAVRAMNGNKIMGL
ncbi:MAG: hypothetical protein EXR77_11470 [Myxococcales bacterium]|nr:hypothetical protein [Myxococcales bacterium]